MAQRGSHVVPDVVRGDDGVRRCRWGASTPDYAAYHDDEWGRPVVDDTRLYEKLCLEGFQSGLVVDHDPAQARELPARVRRVSTRRRSLASPNATSNACSAMPASCATGARSKRRSRTPERSTTARASTDLSPCCCGRTSPPAGGAAPEPLPTSPRRRRSRRRVQRSCCGSGSGSSGRRRSTPRCSRSES